MRPEEIAAIGQLAGELVAGTTERVREIHAGVSRRIFRLAGPTALPVRIVHDLIAGAAYTGTREMTRAAVVGATPQVSHGMTPVAVRVIPDPSEPLPKKPANTPMGVMKENW